VARYVIVENLAYLDVYGALAGISAHANYIPLHAECRARFAPGSAYAHIITKLPITQAPHSVVFLPSVKSCDMITATHLDADAIQCYDLFGNKRD